MLYSFSNESVFKENIYSYMALYMDRGFFTMHGIKTSFSWYFFNVLNTLSWNTKCQNYKWCTPRSSSILTRSTSSSLKPSARFRPFSEFSLSTWIGRRDFLIVSRRFMSPSVTLNNFFALSGYGGSSTRGISFTCVFENPLEKQRK